MPESLRLDGLLVKREGTYGVDASPSASTDGVRLSRKFWSLITVDYAWENLQNDVVAGTIIPIKGAIPRGRKVRFDVFWVVRGKGSDAPPEAADLYIGCGLPEVDGTNLWDYGPIGEVGAHGSCTMYGYAKGLLFKGLGCRGHFQWPLTVGEVAVHQFTMFGILGADPATISLPAISGYDSNEPIAGVNTALTIGSWTPDWLSGSVDFQGGDPQLLKSGNATDGIQSFDYGEVDPTFELLARTVPLSTFDPYTYQKARTTATLAMTFGAAQYNRVKIVGAGISLKAAPTHADSEAFANWNLRWQIESGGILRFD